VRFVAIVALLFIGCSPEVIVEPVYDAGDGAAELVDAATLPDGFVCDLNESNAKWTDGGWFCDVCQCDGQVCRSKNVKTGESVEGVCLVDLKCSETCPSPLWTEQN